MARNRKSEIATVNAPREAVDFTGVETEQDGSSTKSAGSGSAAALLKLIVGGVLVAGLTGGLFWSLYRFAVTTPRFAIKSVEVRGNQRLSDSRVVQMAGLQIGTNIFATNTTTAQRRLLEDPWIQSAQIVRELPSRMTVTLTERVAVALAVVADELFLIAPNGEPFKRVTASDTFDLPLITGLSLAELARDRVRELDRMGIATEVLRQYARLELSRVHPPQEVALHEDGRVTLVVGSRGLHLELGRDSFRTKLLMAGRVISRLNTKGGQPEVIFLDNEAHPDRVVVRLR